MLKVASIADLITLPIGSEIQINFHRFRIKSIRTWPKGINCYVKILDFNGVEHNFLASELNGLWVDTVDLTGDASLSQIFIADSLDQLEQILALANSLSSLELLQRLNSLDDMLLEAEATVPKSSIKWLQATALVRLAIETEARCNSIANPVALALLKDLMWSLANSFKGEVFSKYFTLLNDIIAICKLL